MIEQNPTHDSGPKLESAGTAIRALREQAGLSLQDLASRLEWDKGRLSKYENNQLAMSVWVIEQIADALGKPRLTVLFECLKCRYPALRSDSSRVGKLMQQLLDELGSMSKRRPMG